MTLTSSMQTKKTVPAARCSRSPLRASMAVKPDSRLPAPPPMCSHSMVAAPARTMRGASGAIWRIMAAASDGVGLAAQSHRGGQEEDGDDDADPHLRIGQE